MNELNNNNNFYQREPFIGFNQNFNRMSNINILPHYEIVQVNGRQGAELFQMGPNSRYLLLDLNDPIIWLVQTDGAGAKTITPLDFCVHKEAPSVNLQSLEERISALEEKINVKSNSGATKHKQRNNDTATATDAN